MILTDEELLLIARYDYRDQMVGLDLLRAIEAAILKKIGEPVAHVTCCDGYLGLVKQQRVVENGTALYKLPEVKG